MSDDDKAVKCIILTLKKDNVLVPSAAVAEIMSVESVDEVTDSPNWLLGTIKWRGEDIPLVSFEALSGEEDLSLNRSTQIAVLYGLNDDETLESPYIGLKISGVPHVSRFTADQIKVNEQAFAEHGLVAQRVKVNGVSMSILDIDAMSTMVAELNN